MNEVQARMLPSITATKPDATVSNQANAYDNTKRQHSINAVQGQLNLTLASKRVKT